MSASGRCGSRLSDLAVVLLLAAVVAYFFGDCLHFGPVLDDHWHQKGLRDDPWTLAGLEHTGTIDIENLLDCWWQEKPVRWRYPRPLFIAIMKAVYRACRNDPVGLHALSLILHTFSAILIWRLALWLTGLRFWSVVAALIFAVYQHVVIPVSWPSALNTVIVTFMMLAAMMLYLRRLGGEARSASSSVGPPRTPSPRSVGPRCPTPRRAGTPDATGATETGQPTPAGTRGEERNAAPAGAEGHDTAEPSPAPCALRPAPSSLRRSASTFSILLLFTAGLLVRENMLMLPVLLLAIEATFAGVRSVRRNLGFYAFFAATGGTFLIWRIVAYGGGMPEVYLRRPHGGWGEYSIWLVAKLLHYLTVSIWPGPMVVGPTGRYNPLLERPGDFALMLVLVGVAAWACHRCTRGLAGRWIWPLWLLLAVLPVVPVIATPHSGYLAAAPIALCVLAMVVGTRGRGRVARVCTRALALGYLGLMALFTILHGWEWKGIVANDRYLVEQVCVDPPTPGVTDVYFINLPFANVYARWALAERLGPWFERVRVHVLTFAPHPLLVESHTTVTQLDEHALRVRIEGQPYFSRLLGRFLIEAFRSGGPFHAGQVITGERFDVRVVEGDASGVRALEFRFRKPLTDPTQAFYLASRESIATRLRFEKSEVRRAKSETSENHGGQPPSAGRRELKLPPAYRPADRPAYHSLQDDVPELAARLLAGDPNAAGLLFDSLAGQMRPAGQPGARSPHRLAAARDALALVGCVVSECTGAEVQPLFDCPGAWTGSDIERLRDWWRRRVGRREMRDIWLRRNDFQGLIEWRDEVPHAIWWAGKAIRSDLFLTGPPFPGPRARN